VALAASSAGALHGNPDLGQATCKKSSAQREFAPIAATRQAHDHSHDRQRLDRQNLGRRVTRGRLSGGCSNRVLGAFRPLSLAARE
jgi:hypothetical protein